MRSTRLNIKINSALCICVHLCVSYDDQNKQFGL